MVLCEMYPFRTIGLGSVLVPLAKLLVHDWSSFKCIFKVSHVLFETCLYKVLYTLSSYVVYIFSKAFTAQKH
jgi:hypothetical protein